MCLTWFFELTEGVCISLLNTCLYSLHSRILVGIYIFAIPFSNFVDIIHAPQKELSAATCKK